MRSLHCFKVVKMSRLRKGGLAFDLVDFLVDACVGRGGRGGEGGREGFRGHRERV